MRKVELKMKELEKYKVIKQCHEGKVTKTYCEVKLQVSRRTVDRLLISYKEHGKSAFSHGNCNKKPVTVIPDSVKDDILTLYENKYCGSNLSHFTQLLAEKENIKVSESFIRTLFKMNHILPPKAWKRTKRKEAARLKALSDDKHFSKKTRENAMIRLLDMQDAHPRRERCAYFGEVLQMDASLHLWFGNKKTQLHAAIDDATGTITGLFMDGQETLNGYYQVLYQTLHNYGVPHTFFTDRRTVFEYKKVSSPMIEKDTFTQFSYACSILGINIKTSSVPQAKGRIERLFQTLQSRLTVEFRLNGITTLDEANEFLSHYRIKFNEQFSLPIHDNKNAFKKQPEEIDTNLTLAVLTQRKVDAGHCIKFKNEYYIPVNGNGTKQFFLKGTKVMVIEAFDKKKYLTVDENVYALELVKNRNEFSPVLDGKTKPEVKKQYIPPMTHPWKSVTFEAYMRKTNKAMELQACMEV